MNVAILIDYAGLYHAAWQTEDGQLPSDKHEASLGILEKLREYIVSDRCSPALRYLYRRIGKLTGRGYLVAQGWTDIHACRGSG